MPSPFAKRVLRAARVEARGRGALKSVSATALLDYIIEDWVEMKGTTGAKYVAAWEKRMKESEAIAIFGMKMCKQRSDAIAEFWKNNERPDYSRGSAMVEDQVTYGAEFNPSTNRSFTPPKAVTKSTAPEAKRNPSTMEGVHARNKEVRKALAGFTGDAETAAARIQRFTRARRQGNGFRHIKPDSVRDEAQYVVRAQ